MPGVGGSLLLRQPIEAAAVAYPGSNTSSYMSKMASAPSDGAGRPQGTNTTTRLDVVAAVAQAAGRPLPERSDVGHLEFQVGAWASGDEVLEVDDEDGEEDEDEDEDGGGGQRTSEFVVRAFGAMRDGRSVSLVVRGFTPHFYVKLDPRWTPGQTRGLKDFLKSHTKLDVLRVKQLLKKEFYGFRNGEESTFLRADFRTLRGMKIMADKLKKPVEGRGFSFRAGEVRLFESNIEPMLRFLHMRDIEPAGWVSVPRSELRRADDSRCSLSHVAPWTAVSAVRRHETAPMVIASFDLECNSSHGDFPTARKDYAKLALELAAVFKERQAREGRTSEYESKAFLARCIRAAVEPDAPEVPGISRVYLKQPLKQPLPADRLGLLVDDVHACVAAASRAAKAPVEPLAVLNAALPPVRGDEIIQIGVCLAVSGLPLPASAKSSSSSSSPHHDTRHIFVLGGCDDVPGAAVHRCATEKELISGFAAFVAAVDPDIVLGYNILGFDWDYLFQRADEVGCQRPLLKNLSRLRFVDAAYKETNLSSSALGDNVLKAIEMPGRVNMDLMKVVQRDHKLDSYKLDSVAEAFTGDRKDDVSPADIFRLQRGSDADRAVIAAYCVQDCDLVLLLAWKLETLANHVGMANVCSVPLSYIFSRGQGIKIYSLVAKQCKRDGFVIPLAAQVYGPNSDHADDGDGYEGAIVLEPKPGIYLEPVSVLDYASLYPNSMISENLSHDTLVLDPRYANVPGVQYLDVSYDKYEVQGGTKVKVGETTCRYAQDVGGQKGVIPRILMNLIGQRKATRKMIEHKKVTLPGTSVVLQGPVSSPAAGPKVVTDAASGAAVEIPADALVEDAYDAFQQKVLDGLQLAYKITANSLYGALGARTNPLYLKDIAACTTATGRALILKAKAFVQQSFGARVIYGDSVSSRTPLLVRIAGAYVAYELPERLARLYGGGAWSRDVVVPGSTVDGGTEKEACELAGVEAWTEAGWTPVHRIIRHALPPGKQLFRVMTPRGAVEVTGDHSLLRPDGSVVTPRELVPGRDELLHAPLPLSAWCGDFEQVTIDQARIMGMFLGCQAMDDARSHFLWSASKGVIDLFQEMCHEAYPHVLWAPGAVEGDVVYFTLDPAAGSELHDSFRRLMRVDEQHWVVPRAIQTHPSKRVRTAFFQSLQISNPQAVCRSMLAAATLFALADSIGHAGSLAYLPCSGALAVRPPELLGNDACQRVARTEVMVSEPGECVYDLTTENNHFAAGAGDLVVHNTDSIFCVFDNRDKDTGALLQGKAALQNSIEMGQRASAAFKPHLKPPHDLEYEKTFYPFIILSKKRYVGNLYEFDVDSYKQKSMGIVLKRRDNANIVKHIYGGVIDIILNEHDVPGSVAFLRRSLEEVVSGARPMEDLVITKSLRTTYKDPERIAHYVLAQRMGERDPGNRPQASDRIPYVYIVNPKAALQGERIEHPAYVREKSLNVDYLFYIEHQVMKPVAQLYSIVLEQLEGHGKPPGFWAAEEKKWRATYGGDAAKARDKVADLREREVQRLLFEPIIARLKADPARKRIEAEAKGLRCITDFFQRQAHARS